MRELIEPIPIPTTIYTDHHIKTANCSNQNENRLYHDLSPRLFLICQTHRDRKSFPTMDISAELQKRTPILGLLEDTPDSIGNKDPISMVKALPDPNIDSSPLGIDNMISGLGLPEMNMKRDRADLDGLIGMTKLDRNNPLGSAVHERPGDTRPVFNSFVPLDGMGTPIAPSAGHKGQVVGDMPVVGEMVGGMPIEPLEGLLNSIGVGGVVKRMEKRSRKLVSSSPVSDSVVRIQ